MYVRKSLPHICNTRMCSTWYLPNIRGGKPPPWGTHHGLPPLLDIKLPESYLYHPKCCSTNMWRWPPSESSLNQVPWMETSCRKFWSHLLACNPSSHVAPEYESYGWHRMKVYRHHRTCDIDWKYGRIAGSNIYYKFILNSSKLHGWSQFPPSIFGPNETAHSCGTHSFQLVQVSLNQCPSHQCGMSLIF